MANFKRRTFLLSTGKQIKLFGNSLAINNGLEIGEGAAPNIFSFFEQEPSAEQVLELSKELPEIKAARPKPIRKNTAIVSNPYRLTAIELAEIADYNIRLWMDLKDKIREYGVNDIKVFNRDALR